jgi:hypothetical protein
MTLLVLRYTLAPAALLRQGADQFRHPTARSYNNITQAVVVFMDCVSVSSDFVMKESPSVSCNSSAYKQLYPLFSALLYGVVAGGPAILLVLLWIYHGRRLQLDWKGNALLTQSQALGSGALSVTSASRQSMLSVLFETFKPRYWCAGVSTSTSQAAAPCQRR